MKKILIAYYSRRGLNYVNGSIVNLKEILKTKWSRFVDYRFHISFGTI